MKKAPNYTVAYDYEGATTGRQSVAPNASVIPVRFVEKGGNAHQRRKRKRGYVKLNKEQLKGLVFGAVKGAVVKIIECAFDEIEMRVLAYLGRYGSSPEMLLSETKAPTKEVDIKTAKELIDAFNKHYSFSAKLSTSQTKK